jgi:hypothetical protein
MGLKEQIVPSWIADPNAVLRPSPVVADCHPVTLFPLSGLFWREILF